MAPTDPKKSKPWQAAAPSLTLAGLTTRRDLLTRTKAYLQTVRAIEDLWATCTSLDARTFEPQVQPGTQALEQLAKYLGEVGRVTPKDQLLQLEPFVGQALRKIARQPRVEQARRYENIPLSKVRQQDTRCLMTLARMPGRTIQEKTAVSRKAPAVVRFQSVDTAENRLAKRVAVEFSRALHARLEHENLLPKSPSPLHEERIKRLNELEEICEHLLSETPLGAISPNMQPMANNALISHPDYNSIWRIFRLLRQRQEGFDALWKSGHLQLPEIIAWAMSARLAEMARVWTSASVIDSTSDNSASPKAFAIKKGRRTFLIDIDGDYPRSVSLEACEKSLLINTQRLTGQHLLSPPETLCPYSQIKVHLIIRAHGDAPGRGIPVDIYCHDQANEDLDIWQGFADRQGFQELASWLCKKIGLEVDETDTQAKAKQTVYPEHLGCDFAGPMGILIDNNAEAAANYSEALMAVTVEDEKGIGRALPFLGTEATRAVNDSQSDWVSTSMRQIWERLLNGKQSHREERSAAKIIAGALIDHYYWRTALACAVPDYLDEVGFQQLRSYLPNAGPKWLVWRSVAAAMAWRSGLALEERPTEGDALLVIDAGGSHCSASLLWGRVDADLPSEEDAWYWERSAPFELVETRSELASLNALLDELAKAALGSLSSFDNTEINIASLQARLIDQGGLFESLLQGTDFRANLPVYLSDALHLARVEASRDVLSKGYERYCEHFEAWLSEFAQQDDLTAVQKRLGNGAQLQILLVGAPFSSDIIARRAFNGLRARFPDAKIHLPDDPASIAAAGCRKFLMRHAQGLPTWRDLIPDLYLTVGSGSGEVRIPLLDPDDLKGGVRPGQTLKHQSKSTFNLPPGAQTLDFPLESGEQDDKKQTMHVVLEHRALPLRETVEVRLHINYRYAEDAFRIYLRPVEPSPYFNEMLVQWRRSSAENSGPRVQNLAPKFPKQNDWESVNSIALDKLERHLKMVKDAACPFERKNKGSLHNGIKGNFNQVLKDVRSLRDATNKLGDALHELMPTSLHTANPPAEIASILRKCADLLVELDSVQDRGATTNGKRKKKSKKNEAKKKRINYQSGLKKVAKAKDTRAKPVIDELCGACLGALGRMRTLAPPEIGAALRSEINAGSAEQQVFENYGRILAAASQEDGRLNLDHFLEHFADKYGDLKELSQSTLSELRHHLWALSTAFWTHEPAALSLDETQTQQLIESCHRIADELADTWCEERISIDIFYELGLVILALLRRRKEDGPQDALLHAAGELSKELADLVERIDAGLPDRSQHRPPRIKLDDLKAPKALGRSAFGTMLADTLRGYNVALIQINED